MTGVQLSVKTGKICPAEKCFRKNKAEKGPLLKRHFHMNDEAMDVFFKVIDDFLFLHKGSSTQFIYLAKRQLGPEPQTSLHYCWRAKNRFQLV